MSMGRPGKTLDQGILGMGETMHDGASREVWGFFLSCNGWQGRVS